MRFSIPVFFLLVFHQGNTQPSLLLPKDESAKDPTLVSTITELKRIVNTKDFNALLDYLHPDIQIGFDGFNGKKAFKEEWSSIEKQTKLWSALKRIINLGGVFIKEDPQNTFVFPYAYEVDLGKKYDAYDVFIVTGKNVNVRENPMLTSKVIGQLSYTVVTRNNSNPDKENKDWELIGTPDKKINGYVHRDFLYSPSDYRLFLKKEKEHWLIYMFLVGD